VVTIEFFLYFCFASVLRLSFLPPLFFFLNFSDSLPACLRPEALSFLRGVSLRVSVLPSPDGSPEASGADWGLSSPPVLLMSTSLFFKSPELGGLSSPPAEDVEALMLHIRACLTTGS